MRWYGWLSILLTELISVGLSTIAGILANVLTNEQQPKRSVIVGIIAFAASSANRREAISVQQQSAIKYREKHRNTPYQAP
jgi:hypothetical protein